MFLLRKIEKEFPDQNPIAIQVAFERIHILVAILPYVFSDEIRWNPLVCENFLVHAHNQHFFVIRPVENADSPALRNALDAAPQIIVIQFFIPAASIP